ncbi:MAG: TIGR04551 family protein [Deltaproteobacteria bacterium]|nr:TIGR04551 family protein [Deltaproteobacteria bacterium]
MRRLTASLTLAAIPVLCLAQPAMAQTPPTETEAADAASAEATEATETETEEAVAPKGSAPVVDLDAAIKTEVERRLAEALASEREDMRAEMRAALAASIASQEWQPETWESEEEKLELFELDGYFRVRGDVFNNFDLNAGLDADGRPLFPRPGYRPDESDTLGGANQRLRLDPTINVSEDVKVRATIDVLDNLVWGSTPDAYPLNLGTQSSPMIAFTGTLVEPIAGQNSIRNSISVKRVWAEVMTPVGQLRFGRMGSQWGLGLLANSGNELDQDAGDNVDRLMFVTKIADHYIIPAIDMPSSGRIFQPEDTYQGQAFDLEQRDDVQQYIIAVARRDSAEDAEKLLQDGRWVLNYGMYNVLRVQNIDAAVIGNHANIGGELSPSSFITRGAKAYIPDIWVRFQVGKLRIELEAVALLGKIDNGNLLSEPDPAAFTDGHLDIRQWGAVLQSDYKFLRDKLKVGFDVGLASGDSMPGMGIVATPGGNIADLPSPGAKDGKQFNIDDPNYDADQVIGNFKFDRDYHVDLILWREIMGQITDALYFRPSLSYEITQSLGFDIAAIYSRTIYAASAPGGVNDLGVELDGTVRYMASDGFGAQLQYGILIPMNGLSAENSPEIAQTVQGAFFVQF